VTKQLRLVTAPLQIFLLIYLRRFVVANMNSLKLNNIVITTHIVACTDQLVEGDSKCSSHFIKNAVRQLRCDGEIHGRGLVADISTDLLNDEILHKASGQTDDARTRLSQRLQQLLNPQSPQQHAQTANQLHS